MNDDSSGIDGTGSVSEGIDSQTRDSESAKLTRLLVEGFEPVNPHPDVWPRIEERLWSAGRIKYPKRRIWYPAAAAAVVILIGLTGFLLTTASRDGAAAEPSFASRANVARDLSDPTTGDIALTIHTDDDGSSIAVSTESLPVLDPGSTYQLWSVIGDEVVSVGVFGPSIGSAPLRLEGDPAVLALTVEPTGGVAVSSATPIAIWASTG